MGLDQLDRHGTARHVSVVQHQIFERFYYLVSVVGQLHIEWCNSQVSGRALHSVPGCSRSVWQLNPDTCAPQRHAQLFHDTAFRATRSTFIVSLISFNLLALDNPRGCRSRFRRCGLAHQAQGSEGRIATDNSRNTIYLSGDRPKGGSLRLT